MKILHIIKQMHLGGAEKVVLSLCQYLDQYEHDVLACRLEFTQRLERLGAGCRLFGQHTRQQFRALLMESRPDTVFYHWYPDRYLEAAEAFHHYDVTQDLPGVDWITVLHDAAEPVPPIRSSQHYVAVSRYIAGFHSHIPAERVSLITNGVPLPPVVARAPTDVPTLVKVARADEDRFDEAFFSLLSSLRDRSWTLRLALARGPMLPQIEAWVQAYGLSDRVRVDLDVLDVSGILNAGHIYLDHNPISCREAWGMAVSEALAAGLPVVSRNLYGVREQVEDGHSGFLCDSDEQMRARLVELLCNPELRRDMSRQARARAVHALSLSSMLAGYDALLRARRAR